MKRGRLHEWWSEGSIVSFHLDCSSRPEFDFNYFRPSFAPSFESLISHLFDFLHNKSLGGNAKSRELKVLAYLQMLNAPKLSSESET